MKALRPAIQQGKFEHAYYLFGEDDFLKEEALRHLVDAAADPATRDFNLDQRKGSDLDASALGSILATPPMMADRRVVVIRDVGSLKKDARAVLETALGEPAPDRLIVLSTPADARTDKKLESLATPVECEPLTGAQLPKWIVARAEKTLKTTITPEAVELLQDATGSELSQIAIELDKLAAYCGGRPIDEAAVSAVVGVRRDDTAGQLLEAVAKREPARALELLPGVLQQPKMGPVPLVMALTTQTLALAIGRAREIPPARQSSEFYALLRSGSSNMTGRAWGEAVSSWARNSARWSAADLDRALDALLQADFSLKSSRVSSEEQVLATLIVAMCGDDRSKRAA